MDKSVKICQWNCHSAVANKGNLEYLLSKFNIDVALLSETWFKPLVYYNFQGYNTIRMDRPDCKGGVAILIKTQLKYQEVQLQPFDYGMISAIQICTNNSLKVTFVSIYVRPKTKITTDEWSKFFASIPKPFVIGGDFNAHHVTWGCDQNDIPGKNLLDAIHNNKLTFLNDGSPTFFGFTNNRPSAIDLTICSPELRQLMEWQTLNDLFGSDHVPIICSYREEPYIIEKRNVNKWNTKKANWSIFRYEFDSHCSKNNDMAYNTFVDCINLSADSSIPQQKILTGKRKSKNKFWWNSECQYAVDERKKCFLLYKSNPTSENLINYKKSDALAKRTIKKAKTDSWKSYCNSLNKNTPVKEVWNKVNSFRNRKKSNTHQIDSSADWLEDYQDKLCPRYTITKPLRTPDTHAYETNSYLVKPFTELELNRALKKNCNTSPGKDQIQYTMLNNLPQSGKKTLLNVYNNIWLNKISIPNDWHDYVIVPILKAGKEPGKSTSYRPIALASCILKTYERLIKNRLEHWLESQNLLPHTQFGFRRERSTLENIANLVTDIQIGFTENKYTTGLFIDIQGAYDNVQLHILCEKMQRLKIPELIIHNIYNLYSYRNIYIKASDKLVGPRQTALGLPQGSILSPLLYIIYASDFDTIFNTNMKVLQYADDICIYTSHKNIEDCHRNLEQAAIGLETWMTNNGFEISETKSVVITFTRRRFQPLPTIQLNNYNFPYRPVVKFLGVYLDPKLNWKQHINYISGRAENAVNIIRVFSRNKWGADPNTCLLFYKSFIQSILDYGSILYGSATNTHLNKIKYIQNRCLRLCARFLKTTPINVIENECCVPPPELRREFLSNKFLIKISSHNRDLLKKVHHLTIDVLTNRYWKLKKAPLLTKSYQDFPNIKNIVHSPTAVPNFETYDFRPKICLADDYSNTPEILQNRIFINTLQTKWKDHDYIFTDGSLLHGKTGFAFYHPKSKEKMKFKLPPETSIFTAELVAISEAMKYALNLKINRIAIFSDCKSALEKIKSASHLTENHYVVTQIYDLNKQLIVQGKTVTLVWVKGHCQIEYNDIVDRLAKEATQDGDSLTQFKIPRNDLFISMKTVLREKWQKHYNQTTTGLFYKGIQPTIRSKPWFYTETNVKFIKTINRLRSNHALSPEYKQKFNIEENSNCSCGEIGSLEHIILECPLTTHERTSLLTKLQETHIQFPVNLKYLLCSENTIVYMILYQFIVKTAIQI